MLIVYMYYFSVQREVITCTVKIFISSSPPFLPPSLPLPSLLSLPPPFPPFLPPSPSTGLYLDAQAGLDFLRSRQDIDQRKIIVFGRSLGGAVAIRLTASLSHMDQ